MSRYILPKKEQHPCFILLEVGISICLSDRNGNLFHRFTFSSAPKLQSVRISMVFSETTGTLFPEFLLVWTASDISAWLVDARSIVVAVASC